MQCHEIAANPEGAESASVSVDPRVRLFLRPRRRPSGEVEWDLFHDGERVGTHAKVGRALLVNPDGSRREVAVKLRRDHPLGPPIDPGDASLRFWHEHVCHQIFLQGVNREAIPKVVNPQEHRPSGDLTHPDVIPSCVVCTQARHAIALRGKGELLREGDARGFERRLTGNNAGAQWWSLAHHYDEVLDASLGKDDSACGGCRLRNLGSSACRQHILYVNFYPNEFLLFPVWDTSLEAYLTRANSEALLDRPRNHLVQRLGIAHDVALGLRQLHKAKIWHHDLNPENIVLKKGKSRSHAAIIDLGLSYNADDQHGSNGVKAGDSLNRWPRRLSYAAWECRQDLLEEPIILSATRLEPSKAAFDLDQSSLNWLDYDPPICPGDRIVRLHVGDDRQTFDVLAVERGAEGNYLGIEGSATWAIGEPANFLVERQRGPAADLFSLGMVMIALLIDHPKSRPMRRELEHAQDVVTTLAGAAEPIDPFDLATTLLAHGHAFSTTGKQFVHGRLARYGSYEPLARRALGLALSLTLRGPNGCGAVTVDRRMTDVAPALDKICVWLEKISLESKNSKGGISVDVAKPRDKDNSRRHRADGTLPEDWFQFLPFWQVIDWDGKSQERLLELLRQGYSPDTPQSRETIHEIQATRNAFRVITEFMETLIRFRECRPTGVWARWFRRSERMLPHDLSRIHPAAVSALEKLGHTADIAAAWVKDLQVLYRSARDKWTIRRSINEQVWMGKKHIDAVEIYWEKELPKAYSGWRSEWSERLRRLRGSLEEVRLWLPGEPPSPNFRNMSDLDLQEAANLFRMMLDDVIPALESSPIGPAGDIRSAWIVIGTKVAGKEK